MKARFTLACLAVPFIACVASCGDDATINPVPPPEKVEAPLAPDSPWPKFRRDMRQTGRTSFVPPTTGGALWSYKTEKGIFSSPVIAGDGTIYIGSADRTFYALNRDGTLAWKKLTGEIIDSSALLDDKGRVYFGSGDGHVYALDAKTGDEVWKFQADAPSTSSAFINWFEGNVAIHPNGTLYVPNDNFFIYALDREKGTAKDRIKMPDQTWSLTAIDPVSGDLYQGNNNLLALLGPNLYAFHPADTKTPVWSHSTNGTIAASPLLTKDGKVIAGGFDGFVRAHDAKTGDVLWERATRDHIYASASEMADGTIIQPSADGTIYALHPSDGSIAWAFDTLEAVRSSAAIDGNGTIYVGSGEGRLFVLNPDGTLRWAMRLIKDERNDLNASPSLGKDAIYIAGESGEIFSVPYDYCLRKQGKAADPRCVVGPKEDLPDEGASLLYTTQLGAPLTLTPEAVDANATLAFSLFVRKHADTMLALLDAPSLKVDVSPKIDARVEISGDRRFFTVIPNQPLSADANGKVTLHVTGDYLVDPDRDGLKMTGGKKGGSFDQSFSFALTPKPSTSLTLTAPQTNSDPTTVLEIYRLAAPLPTILPSYNQIGFDSLHYLAGLVEGSGDHFIAWVAGAKLADGENKTVIDPTTRALFPLDVTYRDGQLTMLNDGGFSAEVTGTTLSFSLFRLSTVLDGDKTTSTPRLTVSALCADIPTYGLFLEKLGLCNAQTDVLSAFGAALLRPYDGGMAMPPSGVGTATFSSNDTTLEAKIAGSSIKASEHAVSLLLVDATKNKAVSLSYGPATKVHADASGNVDDVTVTIDPKKASGMMRVYLMIDAYPAVRSTIALP